MKTSICAGLRPGRTALKTALQEGQARPGCTETRPTAVQQTANETDPITLIHAERPLLSRHWEEGPVQDSL